MRAFITGAEGLIGSTLMKELDADCIGFGKTALDVTDPWIKLAIPRYQPDIIIHCAAYTNVDKAEDDPLGVYRINVEGTRNIAEICASYNIPMLFLSTDAVFNGITTHPWNTQSASSAQSIYGKTKSMGELAIQSVLGKVFILRTNWVYGPGKLNFITGALKGFRERTDRVWEVPTIDQIGTPTYVKDLVKAINGLIKTEDWGIYHYTNGGEASRKEVITYLAGLYGKTVSFTKYESKAHRGPYTVLENSFPTRHWQDALKEFICLST